MPTKREWSEAENDLVRAMRAEGRSRDDIARKLGVARSTVTDQLWRLGLPDRLPGNNWIAAAPRPDPTVERDPYPPGHRETWGAIVAGTCLDGLPYPDPMVNHFGPWR